ncbi:MAG TPA: ATP-dependent DNA ligase [Candidatus Baltobacteraceae bacterium]|nr:ATP-dependent DNA ligase [Candidatus Baltobacteraceae bacterium]
MRQFAEVANAVAAQSAKLAKIALIAEYFRTLEDADLEAAARFFTGKPFAARDGRNLNLGGSAIIAAAERAWGLTRSDLAARYRETGDLGSALGPLAKPSDTLQLFEREVLTPARLQERFNGIAAASGKNAGKKREAMLEEILRSCTGALEATYAIKIVTGDLRIGLREGLVHDAIAAAFDTTHRAVHRAMMASGDAGAVAVAAKHHRLDDIHVAFGTPFGFMLASPIPYGETYKELAGHSWFVEDKYDGIRAQAHVHDGSVALFSRTLNDVTHSYPEIAAALARQPRRMILDGEIVALRDGKLLPFRILQARLQRKEIDPSLLAGVPLTYVVFDIIALDDEFLIDEPLVERRVRLCASLEPAGHLLLAPMEELESRDADAAANQRFDAARARGNEGLMLKRTDAPYVPGRRGKLWLKLKRELTTLDVVVVAVEWGHGKRAKVLSDYTFAIQDGEGSLLTIGKAYSGLTDAEIATLTQWFLANETGRRGHALLVEPKIVLEVAFDIVQRSDLHESGYALRFPRIARIRDDKPPSEINTLADVDEIYRQMLLREGIGESR